MRLVLALATVLAMACSGATDPEEAEADPCATWNTEGFFKRASAADVASCLQAGSDVRIRNDDLKTPICMAAEFTSDPEVINVLIEHGALANDWCEFTNWVRFGCPEGTPLHLAAAYNPNPHVSQALIDAGASINAVGGPGWTPLAVAWLFNNTEEVADLLMRNGAIGDADVYDLSLCT